MPIQPITDTERVAVRLHSLFCTLNHEDMCGWDFENSWTQGAHGRYFHQAVAIEARLIGRLETREIGLVLDAVREARRV